MHGRIHNHKHTHITIRTYTQARTHRQTDTYAHAKISPHSPPCSRIMTSAQSPHPPVAEASLCRWRLPPSIHFSTHRPATPVIFSTLPSLHIHCFAPPISSLWAVPLDLIHRFSTSNVPLSRLLSLVHIEPPSHPASLRSLFHF